MDEIDKILGMVGYLIGKTAFAVYLYKNHREYLKEQWPFPEKPLYEMDRYLQIYNQRYQKNGNKLENLVRN